MICSVTTVTSPELRNNPRAHERALWRSRGQQCGRSSSVVCADMLSPGLLMRASSSAAWCASSRRRMRARDKCAVRSPCMGRRRARLAAGAPIVRQAQFGVQAAPQAARTARTHRAAHHSLCCFEARSRQRRRRHFKRQHRGGCSGRGQLRRRGTLRSLRRERANADGPLAPVWNARHLMRARKGPWGAAPERQRSPS